MVPVVGKPNEENAGISGLAETDCRPGRRRQTGRQTCTPEGFGSRDQQEAGQSLVRLVRSEVRTRKKCLNHPADAKRGCC